MNAPEARAARPWVGSSNIASILGIDPWHTALQTYYAIRGEEDPLQAERNEANLTRGKRLEPYILEMLRTEHGWTVESPNIRHDHPAFRHFKAEVDAERRFPGLLRAENIEAKSVHPFARAEWGEEELTDVVPLRHAAQAMWGMGITQRGACNVVALIGYDLKLYRVEYDNWTFGGMLERARHFWDTYVVPGVPPPPATAKDVLRLFRTVDPDTTLPADADIEEKVVRLKRLKVTAKQIDKLEDEVKVFMGKHAVLNDRTGKVIATFKSHDQTRFDEKRFKAERPELAQYFERTIPIRTLRLKGKADE